MGEIFTNYMTKKGLISELYRQLIRFSTKKKKTQFKNGPSEKDKNK